MLEVFKLQRALSGPGPMLVYNRARSVEVLLDETPDVAALFAEHGPKVYVVGQVRADEILEIVETIPRRQWPLW
jgi:hypothetical protein